MNRFLLGFLCWLITSVVGAQAVSGRLVDDDGPLAFGQVALEGTEHKATANEHGVFRIEDVPPGRYVLVAVAVGVARSERTIVVREGVDLLLGDVELSGTATDLEEVVVTGTMKAIARSESPVPVEVISPALFRKNPSPVLFDAVGMVNGVRPQINCSVCNTGDIHINGMEGPYTMVLIDGMPIVSGLSTVYGLSGIPLSLIERVEVVKGPGSSLYGSEAMGGIINVITKDPVLAPQVAVDVMATTWQEYNADLGVRIGQGKVNGLLGMNIFNYTAPRDGNGDGFTDMTVQERVSIFNKIGIRRPDRKVASLAMRYVNEDRWGGQMAWTPAFAGGDSLYGETIATGRWEVIGQYQLPVPGQVMVQVSANGHRQRSFYGTTPYDADQHVYFAQLYGSRKLGPRHELLSGLTYRYTWYDDNTPATADLGPQGELLRERPERRPLPGFFLQDEWTITTAHRLLLGHRVDHDRDHGIVHSPRVAYKWAPNGRWAVRAGLGTGYRVVNLFTEDHAALTGARTVVISEDLLPERSLNGTLNIVRKWPGPRRYFGLDGSLFLTHFTNRILPDYTTDQDLIIYANLDGSGMSRGASLNAEARLGQALRILAGGTVMEVYTTEAGLRSEQYFAPRWSGTFTVGLELPRTWTVDLTGQLYGPMRLPVLPNDPRPAYSPTHALLNVQVKKVLSERFEVYGGVKNLLDFVPADPIMRPFDPFDRYADDPVTNPDGHTFDPSYIYAPVQGIRGFAGVRWVVH